jgi:hypothetical protein
MEGDFLMTDHKKPGYVTDLEKLFHKNELRGFAVTSRENPDNPKDFETSAICIYKPEDVNAIVNTMLLMMGRRPALFLALTAAITAHAGANLTATAVQQKEAGNIISGEAKSNLWKPGDPVLGPPPEPGKPSIG